MLERVHAVPAVEFDAQGYLDDFWHRADEAEAGLLKLERIQHFREPEDPSWRSLMAGDWDRALALIETKRAGAARTLASKDAATSGRLRIIETPISPYLQWELHVLKVWAEAGAQSIRVLNAERVRRLEIGRPLPEIIILGRSVLYHVLYDETGLHSGGRRIDDDATVEACRRDLMDLYDQGEDLLTYFQCEIAPLPPPAVGV